MRVTIAAPGQAPALYLAVLIQENGAWKVLGTLPVDATSPAPTGTR